MTTNTKPRPQEVGRPEEMFGPLSVDAPASVQIRELNLSFRTLSRFYHPDMEGGSHDAFARLNELRDQAERLILAGAYGDRAVLPKPFVVTSKRGTYTGVRELANGDICRVFEDGDAYVLKVVRHPRDNDLLAQEARAIKHVKADAATEKFHNYFPNLIDSFGVRRDRKVRRVNVVERLDGFYTLKEIRDVYRTGLHPKHVTWIFRRLLVALGAAHRAGVVHGAVVPEHVLIHPTMHGVVLVDWCYSLIAPGETKARIKAIVPHRKDFYPPEVLKKQAADQTVDVYMAAKCMDYLLGSFGDFRPFRAFLQGSTMLPLSRNPDDAWALKDEFTELVDKLWPRRYIPLEVPAR